MKILFINLQEPMEYEEKGVNILFSKVSEAIYKTQTFFPINYLVLSSLTPKKYDVKIMNQFYMKDIKSNEDFDLVGISCFTNCAFLAYDIADEYRRMGKKVVIGGWHASALPEEAKAHADSVVIGEAENIWPQLLKDFESGNLKDFYYQEKPVFPEDIPTLNYKNYSEFNTVGVQATRGCFIGCEFCSITNQKYGRMYRMRPIENVIEEIKSAPQKIINFHDTSLSLNIKYSKSLFREMIGLNKRFRCWINANVPINDDEFFNLARKAGCIAFEIGFESFSQDTINSIRKTQNKVNLYNDIVKKIHDYGIAVGGTFMFGFDTDGLDVFDSSIENIKKLDIDAPRFSILTPLPGTPLYDRLDSEGRIFSKDWSKYDLGNVVFQPKNMTPEELEYNTYRVSYELNSFNEFLKRSLKFHKLTFIAWLWQFFVNTSYRTSEKVVYKQRNFKF